MAGAMDPDDLCRDVLAVLGEAEEAASRFGRLARLSCPEGCGDCCRDDRPEDSVLAALPAARRAIDEGLVEAVASAARDRPEGPCVFYDDAAAKHCTLYSHRPLVCRLFGFAGRRDKHGAVRFRPCRRVAHPGPFPEAEAPVFSDFAMRLEGIDPRLGRQRAPLNVAFHRAVQWLLLRSQYES